VSKTRAARRRTLHAGCAHQELRGCPSALQRSVLHAEPRASITHPHHTSMQVNMLARGHACTRTHALSVSLSLSRTRARAHTYTQTRTQAPQHVYDPHSPPHARPWPHPHPHTRPCAPPLCATSGTFPPAHPAGTTASGGGCDATHPCRRQGEAERAEKVCWVEERCGGAKSMTGAALRWTL
jgi:hypothetical protein